MLKKIALFCIISLTLFSCTTEKVNLSPLSESLSQKNTVSAENVAKQYSNTVNSITYTSEITNLLSGFPTFKNNKVNLQVEELKTQLSNYIYALEANNKTGEERYLKSYTNAYKKLQNSKKDLSQNEQEVLNRFLVRLKTNVSSLEHIQNTSEAKN